MEVVFRTVDLLLGYALGHGMIRREDIPYSRNLLFAALHLEPRAAEDPYALPAEPPPDTADAMLNALCDAAVETGALAAEPPAARELFAASLMGLLTARPSEIAAEFDRLEREEGAAAATEWFYALCRYNNYIRVEEIARNQVFHHPSPVGELTITINLSKPEKDPKTIAMERALPPSGYPRCMLCVENPGYSGRMNFPARQNHRMIPLTLDGQPWHLQYSPYLYYNEHCIVLNDRHLPMRIDGGTFRRMFAFVERFPHYFIGSNADLPIVGGSILSHDHFQGGRHVFPMMRAEAAVELAPPEGIRRASIVRWPLSTLRLSGRDKRPLIRMAEKTLDAWREYTDEQRGILAHTDAPHNTITPILYQQDGVFTLDLVLRNNRASQEHPMGIFHPHEALHHIKRENIGLIEVMGLFILPGRLDAELRGVTMAMAQPELPGMDGDWGPEGPLNKHLDWLGDIRARHGCLSMETAETVLRQELTDVCAQVLTDCGVFPQSQYGLEGFQAFLRQVGLVQAV